MPSPTLQSWLSEQTVERWLALIDALSIDATAWPDITTASRHEIQEHVEALAIQGYGLTGLSKVLAQLCPDVIPLMDDAALWFALGAPAPPHNPSKPKADIALFLPMVDWFTHHVVAQSEPLELLAAAMAKPTPEAQRGESSMAPCPLRPAQVLDRLLWFESWGFHQFQNMAVWRWLHHEGREAIIPTVIEPSLPASFTKEPTARQPWPEDATDEWKESALELIEVVYEEAFSAD